MILRTLFYLIIICDIKLLKLKLKLLMRFTKIVELTRITHIINFFEVFGD
jgi:hypothetical protein